MPRKIAGRAISTLDMFSVAMSIATVVFDSTTQR
jgi:hypothetical protein